MPPSASSPPPVRAGEVADWLQELVGRWHDAEPLVDGGGLRDLIAALHRWNFLLWHEEDLARVPTAGDPAVAAVKRAIDRYNQSRHDSIEAFTKGGRPDQAAKEQAEVKILESYLPQAMPEAELEALVKSVITELQATDKKAMGAVMKACQAKAAGRADNRALSALVGKLLP